MIAGALPLLKWIQYDRPAEPKDGHEAWTGWIRGNGEFAPLIILSGGAYLFGGILFDSLILAQLVAEDILSDDFLPLFAPRIAELEAQLQLTGGKITDSAFDEIRETVEQIRLKWEDERRITGSTKATPSIIQLEEKLSDLRTSLTYPTPKGGDPMPKDT